MVITDHAYDRAKERIGFSKKALDKMAAIALEIGTQHKDCKAHLKKYVDKLYLIEKNANNTRIYGEVVYLFNNETLITVFQLPQGLKKYLNLKK